MRTLIGRGKVFLRLCVASWIVSTTGCIQDTPAPIPQATVDTLVSLLNDPDAGMRMTAAEALGKIGDRQAAPYLLRVMYDSEATVRAAAVRSVGQLTTVGSQAAAELVVLLQDSDISVRRAAAHALGASEVTPSLESTLAGLLISPDSTVRRAAVQAYLVVDTRESFGALSRIAMDPDPDVRQWAVAALGESGDSRAVPVLLDRLRYDSIAGVRAEAAYRLRFIGDSSVAGELDRIAKGEGSVDVKRWTKKSQTDLGREATPIQRLD